MKRIILLLVTFVLLFSCIPNKENLKFLKTDLFQKTIVKSQFFKIVSTKDTIIVGDKGTKIVIPKNAFTNSKGDIIQGEVNFELSEALTLDDMILSNLTTTSNGKLLETDGMIFINASFNGEELSINKKEPLYIEIPTKAKKPNMMVYKGVRDSLGNMNWVNPRKLKQYLIPIDLELLDFLPEGFDKGASQYLDFYKKKINKSTIDSLYYKTPSLIKYETTIESLLNNDYCGVQPSEIETIKSNKFNGTSISTKEFEERLKYLFKIEKENLIDIYVENINNDLWISDSLIIDELEEYKTPLTQYRTEEYSVKTGNLILIRERIIVDTIGYRIGGLLLNKFTEFKNQRLTNVEHKNKYINQLKYFYKNRLIKNFKRIDSIRKLGLERESVKEYKKILKERKRIIMQSYGFVQSEFGWVNIDKLVFDDEIIKGINTNNSKNVVDKTQQGWNYQQIDVSVQNKTIFEEIYTYILFKNTKSIVKLNSLDNKLFNLNKNRIPITKNTDVNIVVVAYKNDELFYASKSIKTNTSEKSNNISLHIKKSSLKNFKDYMKNFKHNGESNNLIKDLKLSVKIKKEEDLDLMLLNLAFPACSNK